MTGKQNQAIPGITGSTSWPASSFAGYQRVGIDTHGGGTGAEAATSPPPSS